MPVLAARTFEIRSQEDLGHARRAVLEAATQLEFAVVERTKLVTAASELGRNALTHGKGGAMVLTQLFKEGHTGVQLVFADQGPGIANIEQAMTDGFSTARSMGLGLGGARRLVSEFSLQSQPGQGTTVTIIQWKRR